MAQLSRHLLFTADQSRSGQAADDIFPSAVRPSVMRLLWLGLFAALAFLALIIVLVWWICGI